MKTEIDMKMTFKDLYRFNLYHTYHNSQGIMSILLAVIVLMIAILTLGKTETFYSILYFGLGIILIFYVPISLRGRVMLQLKKSEAFKSITHYVFDENGITTSQGEASVSLPWEGVYKIVGTKKDLLIYQSRLGANVIPRDQLGDKYEVIYELAKSHVPSYRFKMKK